MWTHRNEKLHGTNKKDIRERHLQNLKEQVDYVYEQANELRQHNRDEINSVFKQKKMKRKKHGIVALET